MKIKIRLKLIQYRTPGNLVNNFPLTNGTRSTFEYLFSVNISV